MQLSWQEDTEKGVLFTVRCTPAHRTARRLGLLGKPADIRRDAQRQGLHARHEDVSGQSGTTTANGSTTDAHQKPVHELSGEG
jgi:hypothetical protein